MVAPVLGFEVLSTLVKVSGRWQRGKGCQAEARDLAEGATDNLHLTWSSTLWSATEGATSTGNIYRRFSPAQMTLLWSR